MIRSFLLFLLAFSISLTIFAQHRTCFSTEVVNQRRANDATYNYQLELNERSLRKFVGSGAADVSTASRAVRTIPVVVHVVYHTSAQNVSTASIQQMIDQLNLDYSKLNSDLNQARPAVKPLAANAQIQFCLAQQTPTGQPTNGIDRVATSKTCWDVNTQADSMKFTSSGGTPAWDSYHYLNIWIVHLCGSSPLTGGTAGYAYLAAAGNGLHGLPVDGVVVDFAIGMGAGNHTWSHEVGHYLGLHHTWGDLSGNACGNSFPDTDDGFSDTPDSREANYGCTPVFSCNGNSAYGDLWEDFMDYSDCSVLFTTQQCNWMNNILTNVRSSLFSTNVCTANGAPLASFTANPTSICNGQSVSFTNTSIGSGISYSWSFTGGTPSTSTVANPTITYNLPGTYSVSLTATNSSGSNTSTQTNLVVVSGSNSLPLSEGFEGTTFPPSGWSLYNPDASTTWVRTTSASGFGTSSACAHVYNYNYSAVGQKDWLITPSYNFSSVNAGRIKWDYAYALYSTPGYNDSLEILYSTNCGQTWTSLWKKGGSSLGTRVPIGYSFIPASSEWKRDSVSLAALSGQSNVRFAFKNANEYGNNIFIDNINIYNTNQQGLTPVADFVGTPTTVIAGSTVAFTDISSNNPSAWNWTFAGGTPATSSAQNPMITYNTVGLYAVTLNASNTSGNNSATKTNYIRVIQSGGQTCDTLTNITLLDTAAYYLIPSILGSGYLSGNNSLRDIAKAEFFSNTQSRRITGAYYQFAVAKVSGAGTIQACVWDASGTGGSPGANPIASVNVNISSIISAIPNVLYVSFPGTPTVSGNFYVGYILPTGTGDTVAIATTTISSPSVGQGWEQWGDTTWHDYNDYWETYIPGFEVSNIVFPVLCTTSGNPPTASFTVSATAICAGSTINFTSTSTGNPTSLSWTFPGGTPPVSNAPNPVVTYNNAGTFSAALSANNANGNNTYSSNITVYSKPVLSTTSNPVLCYGGNTGSASVSVSGGAPGYAYNWTGGGTSASISGKTAGTYIVTVTDAHQCSTTASINVGQPLAALALNPGKADAACNQPNGSASVVASGGAGSYIYHWNNNATASSIANLGPGVYSVTVTDASNCTASVSVSINNSTSNFAVTLNIVNTSCGLNNGTAVAIPNNVNFGVTYHWSNGATSGSIGSLPTGIYSVTVTGNAGCTASASGTVVNSTSPIQIIFNTTPAGCTQSNGSANAVISGGSGVYTYAWNTGATGSVISNVAAGGYTLTVNDNGGCSSTKVATINNSGAPDATVTSTPVSCYGGTNGSIDLSVTGGNAPYTYAWSTGATISYLTNLSAGTYNVSVQDNSHCIAVRSILISQPALLIANLGLVNENCGSKNGSITVTTSGGMPPYFLSWAPLVTDPMHLAEGNYSITVMDDNHCTISRNATLSNTPGPVSNLQTTDGTCQTGPQINSAVSGGTFPFIYAWSNGATSQSILNIPSGSYAVTITDASGCRDSSTATVSDASIILLAFTAQDPTSGLSNGSITVSAGMGTAPYSYVWSNGATIQTISNLAAGKYFVTVTDYTGCIKIAEVSIGLPSGIVEADDLVVINVYPNPAKDVCNIQIELSRAQTTGIFIYNETGQIVWAKEIHGLKSVTEVVDISKFAGGVYWIKMLWSRNMQTMKFIKD